MDKILKSCKLTLFFLVVLFPAYCHAYTTPHSFQDIVQHYKNDVISWYELQYVINISVALLMAFPLGWTHNHQSIKTSVATYCGVLLATSLLSSIILHIFITYHDVNIFSAIGGVITGIGFIAGAVIIKQGEKVRGLPVSSSLWATAGVGLAIGLEFYFTGIFVTALLSIFGYFARNT